MTVSRFRRYAVIGGDTHASLSPAIHHYFALTTQKPILYSAVSAGETGFGDAVAAFWSRCGRGLNVTVPHKRRAIDLADKLSGMTRKSGVANVLARNDDGSVSGYNTDGAGFMFDLGRRLDRFDINGRVLVIGAGGAAAGIVPAILSQGKAPVFIANRTPSRALELAARAREHTPLAVDGGGFDEIDGDFCLVVNTISGGHEGEIAAVDKRFLSNAQLAYDLNYGQAATRFLRFARDCGTPSVCDGLGMLVEQAAFSFAIWEGVRPETGRLLKSLRRLLAN